MERGLFDFLFEADQRSGTDRLGQSRLYLDGHSEPADVDMENVDIRHGLLNKRVNRQCVKGDGKAWILMNLLMPRVEWSNFSSSCGGCSKFWGHGLACRRCVPMTKDRDVCRRFDAGYGHVKWFDWFLIIKWVDLNILGVVIRDRLALVGCEAGFGKVATRIAR